MFSRLLILAATFALAPFAAQAQQSQRPSTCLAIAQRLPDVVYASFSPAAASDEVEITYAGHSTYVIVTPAGIRIATDFNGYFGSDPVPDVVTMNKAHSTHYTPYPDPAIKHVLPGWGVDGEPAQQIPSSSSRWRVSASGISATCTIRSTTPTMPRSAGSTS